MNKAEAFLKRGYFPIQLPPGFSSGSFASSHKELGKRWGAKRHGRCRPERFSVARSSYNRRITSILNPISYYFLVTEIVTYWGKIQNHYNKSRISLSRPKLNPSLRAIEISKFSDLYEAKVTRSTGYRYALLTDVSRFFPTIYTHTIPWALHGKEEAKKNTKKKTPMYFGNILDSKSMGIQEWQTMGLPIGPDTSHVIAEIIATAIDKELKTRLGYVPHGFRYVDDYCLFFNSRDEAQHVLAELIKALGVYELQINPDKTRIIEVKDLVEDSWKYSIKHLDISEQVHKQRNDIHKYFESLFTLENKYKDESLVKYGLKKISTIIVKKQNWDIYEAYLLKCGYSFPNTLQVITTILSTYNYYRYPINKNAIQNFCNTLIESHSLSDGHSEIAWALWLAKELGVSITKSSIRAVESVSSSVCLLIALDLYHSGLAKAKPLKSNLQKYSTKQSLYNENWLLSYEAGRRLWLYNKDTKYIEDDDFFKEILDLDISFYLETNRCSRVFEIKSELESKLDFDIDALFESNDDIDEFFEFEEEDEEYFDTTNEDQDEDEFKF
ncbi:MAG: RNA-directed DNA polymerase [Candidatus Pacearchaeota archaeon]|nr:RNA-directed DNA polymerase [Candidatus Pacearchaeota archaeon]